MAAQTNYPRPDPTKMYGLTHQPGTGAPVVRIARSCKVGIGMPKGKDIHAFIDATGKWVVKVGKESTIFETMDQARMFYRKAKPAAPEVNHPRKLSYFTFTRPGQDNTFDPDWETTQAHGPIPREIDIMFTDNRPFQASYSMWSASELKCSGDGINAQRVLSMAQTPEEKKLAAQAQENGERFFPIVSGCYVCDCPYAKPEFKNGKEYAAPCKPHARVEFQLLSQPRLGSAARFETTSIRSISQLFSSLQTFLTFTGQGDPMRGFVAGIPLKLVLQPFRVNHNGQPSTAYSVSLEFRVTDATQLKNRLLERAFEWNRTITPPIVEQRQIEAAATAAEDDEDFEAPTEAQEAAAFTAEFHDDGEDHADETVATEEEVAEIEAARSRAVQQVAARSGYTLEQVGKYIDHPDCVEICRKEYGEPPNEPEGKREKATAQPAEPKAEQKTVEQPQQETLIPQDKPVEQKPAEAQRRKIQFGKR